MLGRKATRLIPTAIGRENARIASHFRRLQMASSEPSPDCFRASSAIVLSLPTSRIALRHQDDVAVADVEVVLLRGGDFVVVEGNPLHRSPVGTENDDLRARRELCEPARQ